jgi:hypothetical protein
MQKTIIVFCRPIDANAGLPECYEGDEVLTDMLARYFLAA